MPYKKELGTLFAEALKEEEIQDGIQQVDLTEEDFASKIKEKSAEIWEAGAKEIEEFNHLEKKRQIAEEELSKAKPPYSRVLNVLEKIKPWSIVILALFVIGYIVAGFLIGWSVVLGWLVVTPHALIPIVLSIATIILVFSLYQVFDKKYDRDFERIMTAKRRELGIDELNERIKLVKQTADKAVIEEGILPNLRYIINMQLTPSYDASLTTLTAPGLTEVFEPAYEIPTESKEKLHRLLNNMSGGSIGIAGPRGSGKTTLLRSFCRESVNEIEGRPVLSVLTSAPVEYEARDFILHIFALVCKQALKLKGEKIRSPLEYVDTLQKPLLKIPFTHLLLSLITPMRGLISFLVGLSLIVLYITNELVATYITAPGINPWILLRWGLFFTILGLLLLFRVPSRIVRRYEWRKREMYKYEHYSKGISGEAQRWLHKIKFQQSYSSGWSGSLKFPIVEGGVNVATSLSQNQLSLPEIIAGYRNFLKLASEEYMVVIGIDELDKLQSDEKAHRFLNEIKAIFGLEKCFYFISVSESAMSGFERRGLPFRDAFDSSFDEIIYVDYLNLEAAKDLIKRRVIGMPIPFVCFCYCMSGGLARDLIRTCRNLLELVQVTEENSLSTLCGSLIRTDLKSKLRAVSIAAKDIMLEPEVTQLLEETHQLETALESPHSLLKGSSDLLYGAKQGSVQYQESEEVLAKREKLASLRDELGTYLYYSVTLLEFFDKSIDIETFKDVEGSGAFEQLARARQFLVFSPSIARSIITKSRKSHKMDNLPTPNEKTIS